MLEFFHKLLSADFMPHAYCLREPLLIKLHAGSDALIAMFYWMVLAALALIIRKRGDRPFPWMYGLVGLFVLGCATMHLLDVVTLWHPVYRFSGFVKVFTTGVSLITGIQLLRIGPEMLSIPSAARLQTEVAQRTRAEAELRDINTRLEQRVDERTMELRQANAALQESNDLLDAVLEALPVSLVITDSSAEIVRRNKACLENWGGAVAKIDLKDHDLSWVGYWPESGRRLTRDEWPRVRAVTKGEIVRNERIEVEWVNQNDRRVLDVSAAPVHNKKGDVVRGVLITMDVTARVRAEETAHRKEATLNAVLDSLPVAVAIANPDGCLLRTNAAFHDMWGNVPSAQTISEYGKFAGYWVETGRPVEADEWAMSRALMNGEVVKGDLIEIEKFESGERRFMLNNAAPVRDSNGKIIAGVVAALDITEFRRTSEALKASESRFRTLAESVPNLLWTADAGGKLTYTGPGFPEYTGRSSTDLVASGWVTISHPDDRAKAREGWQKAVDEGTNFECELRLRRKDGQFCWFVSRGVPLRENGQITQWMGSATDIDKLKRTEHALLVSNHDLRQFAYAAGHDLQEPIRNIATSLQLVERLYNRDLRGDASEIFHVALESSHRAYRMIKGLLSYARVMDDSEAVREIASAKASLDMAIANLRDTVDASGAEIDVRPLPVVRVSEVHMVQVFQNLLGNALKYRNPDARPKIVVCAEQHADFWHFTVSDNGIGFKPEYANKIFGLFKRLHRDQYEGHGIGLALCHRIVNTYGGRIWAESQEGQGATFHFTLPGAGVGQGREARLLSTTG